MPVPQSVRLFHITAIANLPGVFAAGALLAKNAVSARGKAYTNIAHAGAQGARGVRSVPNPPGGVLHNYVPFYYAPRSPMLSAIHHGRVDGCSLGQADVVHFETTVDRVLTKGVEFVIFERNATLEYAKAYTSLADLDKVAWDLICEAPRLDGFCKYFFDVLSKPRYMQRQERRMAEFLVKGEVPLNQMLRIGVMSVAQRKEVLAMMQGTSLQIAVEVKPDWYFLGQ